MLTKVRRLVKRYGHWRSGSNQCQKTFSNILSCFLFLISRRKKKGTVNPFVQSNLSKVRLIPNNRPWKEGALWCFNIFQGNCYYSMCCLTIPLCAFHDLVVNFVMDYHTGQIYSDQASLASCSSFKFFMGSSRSACFIKLKCAIEWISWFA